MATKQENMNNPNSCWNRAHPAEEVFVLLARDPLASLAVDYWAALHRHVAGAPAPEAKACAQRLLRQLNAMGRSRPWWIVPGRAIPAERGSFPDLAALKAGCRYPGAWFADHRARQSGASAPTEHGAVGGSAEPSPAKAPQEDEMANATPPVNLSTWFADQLARQSGASPSTDSQPVYEEAMKQQEEANARPVDLRGLLGQAGSVSGERPPAAEARRHLALTLAAEVLPPAFYRELLPLARQLEAYLSGEDRAKKAEGAR